MEQYRKAVAAVVGVVLLLLAQVFHLDFAEGFADSVVNLVLAAGTVYAVYKARNVKTVPVRIVDPPAPADKL